MFMRVTRRNNQWALHLIKPMLESSLIDIAGSTHTLVDVADLLIFNVVHILRYTLIHSEY
jgi:hypothetical protein